MKSINLTLGILALVFSSFIEASEPIEGWGPHYLSCLPDYQQNSGSATFNGIKITDPIYKGIFTKYDSNNLVIWEKEISFWRIQCAHNPNYSALMMKIELLSEGLGVGSLDTYDFEMHFNQDGISTTPFQFSLCSNISECTGYRDKNGNGGLWLIPYMKNSQFDMSGGFSLSIETTQETLTVAASNLPTGTTDQNQLCKDSTNTTINTDLSICIPSAYYDVNGSNQKIWGRFEYSGIQNGVHMWNLVGTGEKTP